MYIQGGSIIQAFIKKRATQGEPKKKKTVFVKNTKLSCWKSNWKFKMFGNAAFGLYSIVYTGWLDNLGFYKERATQGGPKKKQCWLK